MAQCQSVANAAIEGMTASASGGEVVSTADTGQHADDESCSGGAPHREVGDRVADDRGPAGIDADLATQVDHHVRFRLDREAVVGAGDRVDQRSIPSAAASARSAPDRRS